MGLLILKLQLEYEKTITTILYKSDPNKYIKVQENFKLTNLLENFPLFIPSITSIKNFHNYLELFKIILESNTKAIMISALDINYYLKKEPKSIIKFIDRSKNKFIFLDSGGFEKHNIPYYNEKWEINDLILVAEKIQPNILVAFDIIHNYYKSRNYEDISLFVKTLELADGRFDTKKKFEVIIHSFNLEEIFNTINDLKNYDKYLYAIGIPERNLGNSIRTRMSKVKRIVNYIKNSLKWNTIYFHLFGCSDPLDMIKYSKLGVDIFDGVHWQDLIINPLNYTFFSYSNLMKLNCKCSYCKKFHEMINRNYDYEENNYNFYAINHNLELLRKIWD